MRKQRHCAHWANGALSRSNPSAPSTSCDRARAVLTRVEGGALTRIARDFNAETKALRALGEWGFEPLQSVGVFNNLPKECVHDWIVHADGRAAVLIDFVIP